MLSLGYLTASIFLDEHADSSGASDGEDLVSQ